MSDQPSGARFATLAIHAGTQPSPEIETGSIPTGPSMAMAFDDPPLFGSSAFAGEDWRGSQRINAVLEERVAALEGGSAAVAVTSGQAARLLTLHALMESGDEIVAARRLGLGSADPFSHSFQRFGWQVKWADPERPDSFVEALSDRTKAILVPSIADPGGQVTDLEAVARVAQRARVPLIVDNTLATPYLVRPFEHGADIVLHAANRFLGSHGTSAGLIVDGGSFDWAGDARYPALSGPNPSYGGAAIGEKFGNYAFAVACRDLGLRELGPALSSFDAFLVLQGIETLPLRMQRHCGNALAVAQHLAQHPAVAWVRYAGLDSDPGYALARRYCPNGAGAVLTFGVVGGYEAGARLTRRLRLLSESVEIGNTRSLVSHPPSTAHPRLGAGEPSPGGGAPDLIRVSIGLEDPADIIADLDQALAGSRPANGTTPR